jgi:hypothetical protein
VGLSEDKSVAHGIGALVFFVIFYLAHTTKATGLNPT